MATTKVYLEISDKIQQLLSDNRITIKDILQNEGIDAEVAYGVLPYQVEEGARSKDVVTIIIVASAAVMALSFAISQVLNTLYRKPYLVEISENQELRDSNGNILLDGEGKPLLKPIKRYELIEPRTENQATALEINLNWKNGLLIKVSSEEEQMDALGENLKP